MPETLNVLLIGGGAREHALAIAISRSPRLRTLYTTHPSNPGLAALAQPVDVPVSAREFYRLEQFIARQSIDLIVIGPEEPLAEGYADRLRTPTTRVFGHSKDAAQLEANKAWCKQILRSASIPTAEARAFTDPEAARVYFESREGDDPLLAKLAEESSKFRDPQDRRKFIEQKIHASRELQTAYAAPRADLPVLKAAGLAKGKGVVLPGSLAEAIAAIDAMMVRQVFGDAGRQVVIEERLTGPEVSVLALTDGRTLLVLPPCQDHKRLGDGDTGPNTGGMGAFCPTATVDEALMSRVEREILVPTLDALRREGISCTGVLYAGLMLTHAGPKVLEYNVRFGDPECQPLMARLRSDIIELMLAACDGKLEDARVEWDPRPACCVVLASAGYPESSTKGVPIHGLDAAAKLSDVTVTHAATRRLSDGTIVTDGGRVLSVTALGDTMADARRKAYQACDLITFKGKVYRTDIAASAT